MDRMTVAHEAIEWHKQQEARGESPWSCRLYDGEDSGPPERRCWLQPGHQCDCMTEAEARHLATLPPEVADEPIYSHPNHYIDRLTGIPTFDVWYIPSLPPQPHRTPTHARHGGQRGDKAARKAQKQARKANRGHK